MGRPKGSKNKPKGDNAQQSTEDQNNQQSNASAQNEGAGSSFQNREAAEEINEQSVPQQGSNENDSQLSIEEIPSQDQNDQDHEEDENMAPTELKVGETIEMNGKLYQWDGTQWDLQKGAGDIVKEILESPVVNPITNAVKSLIWQDGEDCGCKERAKKLNLILRRHVKGLRCITEEQYHYLDEFFNSDKVERGYRFNIKELKEINKVFSHVYKQPNVLPCTTCPDTWRQRINILKKVYELYKSELDQKDPEDQKA